MMKYLIPEVNMEELNKKLDVVKRNCARYGCTFHFSIIGEHYRTHRWPDGCEAKVKYIEINVSGIAKVNGWELRAIIDHSNSGGNVVYLMDEGQHIPAEYYHSKSWCDHCNTYRDRKYTAILFNENTNEFKQIGSACLKLYTQGFDAKLIASALKYFKVYEECQHTDYRFFSYNKYYDLDLYLAYAIECIDKFGFVSSRSGYPTKDVAFDALNHFEYGIESRYSPYIKYDDVHFDVHRPEISHKLESVKAYVDMMEDSEEDSYQHNVKVAFSNKYVSSKLFAFIAAAVNSYNKYEAQMAYLKAKKDSGMDSKHVGNIGDKIQFDVSDFAVLSSYMTPYGYKYIYKFVDMDQNIFIWRTGKVIAPEGVKHVFGTVKCHSEFKNEAQTELIRCKVSY